jgi:hypothetical protein
VRPNDSKAEVVREVRCEGKQSVRIDGRGAVKRPNGQILVPNFVSSNISLKPYYNKIPVI